MKPKKAMIKQKMWMKMLETKINERFIEIYLGIF